MSSLLQPNLKWEQRHRLTLLEATVFWSGEISTGTLINYFGISRVQASKDLTLYQSLCPGNIRYDKYLKRYVVDESFKPGFMDGTTGELLQVLKLQQQNGYETLIALVGNLPTVEIVNPLARQIDTRVLRGVVQAVRFKFGLEISYQSLSSPEPKTLQINPHTLVFDGLRWHVRSFSVTHNDYRDFVLARIHRVSILGKADEPPFTDTLWNKWLTVEIGPHPGLNDAQKSVIERDFGMVDGKCVTQIRAALLSYFLLSMRIGKDDLHREAMEQQIVLLNRDEIKDFIFF
ncbi:MAG: WYL domain-containing protein [Gammaproteobacteria bacterium]|nr:WYL domain-containing protein [Gammaproteobacteria bacterium]